MDTKRCSRCKETKSLDAFYRNRSKKQGRECYCKSCRKEYNRQPHRRAAAVRAVMKHRRTEKGREQHRKANAKYYRSEKGKRRKLAGTKRYQRNHRTETLAHRAVAEAVKKGIIPSIDTQICGRCGDPAAHYHHNSYAPAKWLHLSPVCERCHRIIHRRGLRAKSIVKPT